MPPTESAHTAHILDALNRVSAKMICSYDLGDNREHGAVVEKRLPISR